ncbi:MAG: VacB/RNase II family 3'-5' exoribonuclease [Verrucomicrobiota bacterium]
MNQQNQSLEDTILTLLRAPRASGLTKNEIARALEISTEERSVLRGVLRDLTGSGMIIEGEGRRFRVRDAGQRLLTGSIFIRPGGEGSFRPERGDAENAAVLGSLGVTGEIRIPISTTHLAGALNGDVVSVKVSPVEQSGRSTWNNRDQRRERNSGGGGNGDEPRLEGRIVKILERRNEQIAGTLFMRDRHAWVIPDDPLLPNIDLQVSGDTEAKAGDKVVVGVDEWPTRGSRMKGHLVKRLGRPGEKGVDVLGIIYKFRLPLEFPENVLREAAAFPEEIPAAEIARREDCRRQHIITIDPFDARDFDDAIGVKELPKGGFELSVHIADVAHYVPPGSALDKEARERGNSTYLVDRVIPMLPERLSNGLCSLRPNEDKLTRFAVLTYDAKGRRTGQRFGSGVIRSSRRYSYEEAMKSLKSPVPGDADSDLLQRAWSLASKLRGRRYQNGALDLDFPEIKIILDDKGVPVRLATILYDESHQLIEEFMLAANEAVAEELLQSGRPAIYRVHEDPDQAKLDDLRQLLGAAGIHTGDLSVRTELQRAIAAMAGRAEEPVLKISLLKSLKRAVYHPDSLGHYGLNFKHYTHFTSPIRRYADLIVHRLLWNLTHARGAEGTIRTPDYAHMKETADHISTTERTSADAEMESRRLKELEYFESLASSPNPEPWPCLVSRVLPFGLFIETAYSGTRGAIRLPDLGWPDPFFDGASQTMRNRRPPMAIKAGDRVDAVPTGIDRERGTVNFRLLGLSDSSGSGKKAPAGDQRAPQKNHRPGNQSHSSSDRRPAKKSKWHGDDSGRGADRQSGVKAKHSSAKKAGEKSFPVEPEKPDGKASQSKFKSASSSPPPAARNKKAKPKLNSNPPPGLAAKNAPASPKKQKRQSGP